MSVPATLLDLQTEIRLRSREDGMCESLQDVLTAPDYAGVVQAGLSYIRYAVESGIMDDDMISGIPEATLNDAGVYSTGTPTITNPDKEIYLLKNVVATINITSPGKYRINAFMQATATINASNQAFVRVVAFDDAIINCSNTDTIISNIHITHNAALTVTNSNDVACNIISEGNATISLTTNNSSYTSVKMYGTSFLEYTQNDTSTLNLYNYESSGSDNLLV